MMRFTDALPVPTSLKQKKSGVPPCGCQTWKWTDCIEAFVKNFGGEDWGWAK